MSNKIILGIAVGAALIGIGVYYIRKNENKIKRKHNQKRLEYEVLKFSDVLNLVNDNYVKSDLKEDELIVLIRHKEDYVLTVYNKMSDAISDGNTLTISTKELDENLTLAFGSKDMIILE